MAIELLWMTALRIKNLASLHLDTNIVWAGSSRRGICHLVVDARDVKNHVDRDLELEGATFALLKTFVEKYRQHLVPASCRWLFARRDGDGSVHEIVLARRISRTIFKWTGLIVNVHLFRSLGVKLFLDRNPGDYEVPRQVLGHKHLSTTTSAYTGMESISAAKQFDRVIREQQNDARAQHRRRGQGPEVRR